MSAANEGSSPPVVYVTLSGLPLLVDFHWPFHSSSAGADFWVLHADVKLGHSGGLHAAVAVNLSATIREVLPSTEPKDVEGPVVNALRKEVDRRQLEFLRSGKLVPVHFSSRYYDFKRNKWVFGRANDEEIARLIARKIFWQTQLMGGKVWIGDPAEALYVETTVGHLLEIAAGLASSGLIALAGEHALAEASLLAETEKFEADRNAAFADLQSKHAFEDAKRAV
jgi:hypothetical protein